MARKQEIEIDTRLGRRRIDTDKVIHFPRGLAGFEGTHQFTLLQIRPEAPMLILQSLDDPSLGLLVADPYSFLSDYKIWVGDAEQKLLRLKSVEQVAVLVTVTIPQGKPADAVLNLTGPILVNHEAKLGLQVPQANNRMPAQVKLHGPRPETSRHDATPPQDPVEPSPVGGTAGSPPRREDGKRTQD